MILGRDLLNTLGRDIKFSEFIIIGGKQTYEGCLTPMVDLINYDFTSITYKTVKTEESFINSYVEKCLGSESAISSTCRMRWILDSKHQKSNLNTVMDEQYKNPNAAERYILLTHLSKFEYIFAGTFGI